MDFNSSKINKALRIARKHYDAGGLVEGEDTPWWGEAASDVGSTLGHAAEMALPSVAAPIEAAKAAYREATQTPTYRAAQLPYAEYTDHTSGFALPQMVYDTGHAMGKMGNALREAFTNEPMAPSEVMPTSQDVNLISALAMTGGMAIPKPSESLGIFGGRLSHTADHQALAKAEEMSANLANPESIWNETGWFQGVDGKWRHEIPGDQNADFYSTNDIGRTTEGPLWDQFHHPELQRAYPQLQSGSMAVKPVAFNINSEYMSPKYAEEYYKTRPNVILPHFRVEAPAKYMRSAALHELQHGVQDIEGLTPGGAPLMFAPGSPAFEHVDFGESLQDAYKRIAGEVEARNVQTRADLPPDQLKNIPPWGTEDIDRMDQVPIHDLIDPIQNWWKGLSLAQKKAAGRIDPFDPSALWSNPEEAAPVGALPAMVAQGTGALQSRLADPAAVTATGYHGAPQAFEGRMHPGEAWFGNDPALAGKYAGEDSGAAVYPGTINFKNALNYPEDVYAKYGVSGLPSAEEMRAAGYDGAVINKGRGRTDYMAVGPGTVTSPLTGQTLFSNPEEAAPVGALPAMAAENAGANAGAAPQSRLADLMAQWEDLQTQRERTQAEINAYGNTLPSSAATHGYELSPMGKVEIAHGSGEDEHATQLLNKLWGNGDERNNLKAAIGEEIASSKPPPPGSTPTDFGPAPYETDAGPEGYSARVYRGWAEGHKWAPENTDVAPPHGQWWGSTDPQVSDNYTRLHDTIVNPHYWGPDKGPADFPRPAMMPADVRFKNPMMVDAQGSNWSQVEVPEKYAPTLEERQRHNLGGMDFDDLGFYTTDDLAKLAKARGHDGLVVRNVEDDGPQATTVAALKPNTVFSPLTGERIYSNPKEGALPALTAAATSRREIGNELTGLPSETGRSAQAGAEAGRLSESGGLPSGAGQLAPPGGPRDPYAAIPGIPSTAKIPGYGDVDARPVPWLVDSAKSYLNKAGREHASPGGVFNAGD